jgi:glycosyltransferase involved in cell wall biosynthesis
MTVGTRVPTANRKVIELSIVMPCLNEAETLAYCIQKAQSFMERNDICGEVIVADNGSKDGSQSIAESLGAIVVNVPDRGYGSALMGGIASARGRYVIMGDADDSYDFSALEPYVEKLREGYELVMGNRFEGGIEPGAMPALHRYVGNPMLSGIGRLFFRNRIGDYHCGLRGFDKNAIDMLDLQTTGMEFASEMVVKASLNQLRITEVPTTLTEDGRSRPPHLRSYRDGWRHLRFLLIFSPRWLFFYPGLLFVLLGVTAMIWLMTGPVKVGGIGFDINAMLYAALLIIVGVQTVYFAIFSKVYGVSVKLIPSNKIIDRFQRTFTLERGLAVGGIMTLIGIGGLIYAIVFWGEKTFGALVPGDIMRITIPSLTLTLIGVQTIFASFFLTTLNLKRKK